MKKISNGEVFFILFLFGGAYKASLEGLLPSFLDVTLIFMILSMLYGVVNVFKTGGINKVMASPLVLMVFFILIAVISLLYVDMNPYSVDKTIKLMTLTFWSFIGPFLLVDYSNPKQSLRRFFGTMVFVGVTISAISVISYLTTGGTSSHSAISFGTDNYLHLGRVAAISALILLSYLFLSPNVSKIKRFMILSVIGISIVALFISGGRMPVIAFIISLAIMIMMDIDYHKIGRKRTIVVRKKVLLYSYFGIWTLPFLVNLIVQSNFFNRFIVFFEGDGGASASRRLYTYNISWDMIQESNFLGFGIGSFLNFIGGYETRSYPHNMFLEILAELGIIAFLLFVVMISIGVYRYFKFNKGRSHYSVAILGIFVYFFLNAMVSGDLNDNRFLFFALALLLMSKTFAKNAESEQTSH